MITYRTVRKYMMWHLVSQTANSDSRPWTLDSRYSDIVRIRLYENYGFRIMLYRTVMCCRPWVRSTESAHLISSPHRIESHSHAKKNRFAVLLKRRNKIKLELKLLVLVNRTRTVLILLVCKSLAFSDGLACKMTTIECHVTIK